MENPTSTYSTELSSKKLQPSNQKRVYRVVVKPFLDVIVSGALFIILAPLLLLIYIIIRLESPGPGIFKQERIGKHGTVFTIFKFRTMYAHVPKEGRSPEQKSDPRITRVGRFLRKTSLDELPQLMNILKGEMSFIGPRPEQRSIVEKYFREADYYRFDVKPGITGLWQTSEDRKKPIQENLQHDFVYIEEHSLWLDMKIVFRTVKVLFKSNTY